MPVTERLIIPAQGGVDGWKDAVKILLQTLKKQEGYVRTRWGPHFEDESKLEFLVGWESVSAQQKFQASADFASTMTELKPIMSGAPQVCFVTFVPYAPKEVIDATMVQVLTFSDLPDNAKEDDLRTMVEIYKMKEGCTGVASGMATGDQIADKQFVAVIGWTSLDLSKASGVDFKAVGAKEESHHVNFRFPVKGFRGL